MRFSRPVLLVLFCATILLAARLSKQQQAGHALHRLTFGPRPGDVERVARMGVRKWVQQQLNPSGIVQSPELEEMLNRLPSLQLSTAELVRRYPSPQMIVAVAAGRAPMPEEPELRSLYERLSRRYQSRIERKTGDKPEEVLLQPDAEPEPGLRRRIDSLSTVERADALRRLSPQQAVAAELTEAKLYRAVYSERQLEEVLVDFWFNHFNVFLDKGAARWLTTAYERDAIRPFVLGRFIDMLRATARHPAMLFYLDNWTSIATEAGERLRREEPNARARGLNENYARELMELHTLGVDGGYTQNDVQQVARCFTGWTIEDPNRGGSFRFAPRAHDNGEKVVLGVRIPAGGGMADGEKVIEILAAHSSTARFLSRKLAQRFVSDQPSERLVGRLAQTFTKSGGDLRAVMTVLFESDEFWSPPAYRAKLKSPLEMVAGALRATGANMQSAFPAAQAIARMGQPLYRKQEPTGYPDSAEDWLNSAGLLERMNFAIALAGNRLPGIRIDGSTYAAMARGLGAPEAQRR